MCVCVCAPFVCLQCICVCAHMFMRVQLVPLSFGLDIKGNAHTDGRHIWAAIPNSTIKLIELLILLCLFLSLSACPSELDSGRCVAACLTCIHPCLPATTSPYLLSPAVCLLLQSRCKHVSLFWNHILSVLRGSVHHCIVLIYKCKLH